MVLLRLMRRNSVELIAPDGQVLRKIDGSKLDVATEVIQVIEQRLITEVQSRLV